MLIFPGEEDFGIVPLEAQACGRPVVAYKKGGALETVSDGISGLFFDEQNEKSLTDGISRSTTHNWDKNLIRKIELIHYLLKGFSLSPKIPPEKPSRVSTTPTGKSRGLSISFIVRLRTVCV